MPGKRGRKPAAATGLRAAVLVALAMSAGIAPAAAQVISQPSQTLTIPRGTSQLLLVPEGFTRLAIGDPEVANFPDPASNNELIINGLAVGTTSLFVWTPAGVRMYAIEVIPDITALQRQIELLFPTTPISLSASGNTVVVSGTIDDPLVARRILEILEASGVQVIDNLVAPSARQILLHVRFAEVNRSALSRLGSDLFFGNPQDLGGAVEDPGLLEVETLSQGIVRLFLLGENGASLESVINALKTNGMFRSLAEPNLVTMENHEATFLAGGEFPFPSVQGGAQNGGISIVWKEFGIRLRFTPQVMSTGVIRLNVAPEVSSLDFANGLTVAGFQIPSILTRRTESQVELAPGEHLAIAGLLDNTMSEDVTKIPLLGDLPILGTFFQSREARNNQTELLVVVTPHIVEPTNVAPALPTGEPVNWDIPDRFKQTTVGPGAGVRIRNGGN